METPGLGPYVIRQGPETLRRSIHTFTEWRQVIFPASSVSCCDGLVKQLKETGTFRRQVVRRSETHHNSPRDR